MNQLRDGFAFAAGLSTHVERRLDVINRGFSGYNSSHLLHILEHIIPSTSAAKVDYILVLLGSNDSCLPESPTGQHISLPEYQRNITTIVNRFLNDTDPKKLFLVTPPPVNEIHLQEASDGQTLTRHQSFTAKYAQVVREVAEELNDQRVVLVDLWSAIMQKARLSTPDQGEDALPGSKASGDNEQLREFLSDGLHLTGAGYKIFLNNVLKAMGDDWKDESSDHKDSWVFPRWEDAPKC
ncbi:putative GDSL esterase/lipase [Glarea lozoyensis 74030]|nr:putative GDSL esterase/lipase [Glarea lozoyensis 74030]